MLHRFCSLLLLAVALTAAPAQAQQPAFDAEAATDRYLATVPPAEKARSDAYFEGGYWLILWDFLYGAAVMILLLETRASARMRDFAERLARRRPLATLVYWFQLQLAVFVLGFPLTVYQGFFRERQYGLMNQTFGQWFGDQAKELALAVVLGGLAVMCLMEVVRRLPRTWHIWGAITAVVFLIIALLAGPVFIAPLFNQYTPLTDPKIRGPVLSLARANGVPASEVYVVDESRQSDRISANVSGFLGTERISLNDNLLKRCTPEEILSVMAHETGHYVLHHVYNSILFSILVTLAAFWLLRWALDRALARRGERWGIRGVADVAVVPLAALILSVMGFLFTPIGNNFSREQEYEADMFALNAARQPDAEAKVDLMLVKYRKLDPTPLEEWLFYDHPSGRARVYAAMRWKANTPDQR